MLEGAQSMVDVTDQLMTAICFEIHGLLLGRGTSLNMRDGVGPGLVYDFV